MSAPHRVTFRTGRIRDFSNGERQFGGAANAAHPDGSQDERQRQRPSSSLRRPVRVAAAQAPRRRGTVQCLAVTSFSHQLRHRCERLAFAALLFPNGERCKECVAPLPSGQEPCPSPSQPQWRLQTSSSCRSIPFVGSRSHMRSAAAKRNCQSTYRRSLPHATFTTGKTWLRRGASAGGCRDSTGQSPSRRAELT